MTATPVNTSGPGRDDDSTVLPGLLGYDRSNGAPVWLPRRSLLIAGGTPTGKTVVAARLAQAAMERGERCWAAGLVPTYGVAPDRNVPAADAPGMIADVLDGVAGGRVEPGSPLTLIVDEALGLDGATLDRLRRLAELGPAAGVTLIVTTRWPQRLPAELVASVPDRLVLWFPIDPESRVAAGWLEGAASARQVEGLAGFDGFLRLGGTVAPIHLLPLPESGVMSVARGTDRSIARAR